jgi:hypothetical protein
VQFARRLREGVKRGEVTKSIRIWQRPRVRVGGRHRLDDGWVVIDALHEIALEDVTPRLARETGFAGVVDLLKVAKHGLGERVFLIEFHYVSSSDEV